MNRRIMFGGAEMKKYGPLIYARGVPNFFNDNLHWDYSLPNTRESIWYNDGELFPDRIEGNNAYPQEIVHPIPIPAGSGTVTINIDPLSSIDYMLNFYHIESGVWKADSSNTWVINSSAIVEHIPAGATHLTIGMRGANNAALTALMTVKQMTIAFE